MSFYLQKNAACLSLKHAAMRDRKTAQDWLSNLRGFVYRQGGGKTGTTKLFVLSNVSLFRLRPWL